MRNPRQVLPRALIYERVWGYDFSHSSNALDVYVGYLRRKTEGEERAAPDPHRARHRVRPPRAMTFRLRLALVAAAVVAVVGRGRVAVVYVVMRNELRTQRRRQLGSVRSRSSSSDPRHGVRAHDLPVRASYGGPSCHATTCSSSTTRPHALARRRVREGARRRRRRSRVAAGKHDAVLQRRDGRTACSRASTPLRRDRRADGARRRAPDRAPTRRRRPHAPPPPADPAPRRGRRSRGGRGAAARSSRARRSSRCGA